MHYHQYGSQFEKPKYLFGETSTLHSSISKTSRTNNDYQNEIFLNKSGWVQVTPRDENSGGRSFEHKVSVKSRFENNSTSSKLEDLINRNELRKTAAMQNFYQKGYLPNRNNSAFGKIDSPAPMTPILSPPPAFQDAMSNGGGMPMKSNFGRVLLTVNDEDYYRTHSNGGGSAGVVVNNNGKGGMVFSRSFEYDNRKKNVNNTTDIFSKSFEYDLLSNNNGNVNKIQPSASLLQIQRERIPAFSNLTGNSPNYLTKKESTFRPGPTPNTNSNQQYMAPGTNRSRDTSPNQSQMKATKGHQYSRNFVLSDNKSDRFKSFDEQQQQMGRSRRAQFSRLRNESNSSSSSMGFRSVDVAAVNRRLNSCDSGARSDVSNDDNDDDEEPSSSLALSYSVPHPSLASSTNSIKKQRSLTPDKDNNDDRTYHANVKKQRSLTPERRTISLTPEERRKVKKVRDYEKEMCLRNNSSTIERPKRLEDKVKVSSRSSSTTSSGSGEENKLISRRLPQPNRIPYKLSSNSNNATSSNNSLDSGDHRIRRSRSLQLTERSPNKLLTQNNHKTVVRLGPNDNADCQPQVQRLRTSPSQRRHRSPIPRSITHGGCQSMDSSDATYENISDDLYNKSRSFDEDYSNERSRSLKLKDTRSYSNDRVHHATNDPPATIGNAGTTNVNKTNQLQPNSASRLYEHNLMCDIKTSAKALSYRNRSPIMMDFRHEPVTESRDRSPAMQPPLDESEQFYHLKKLLSNANLKESSDYIATPPTATHNKYRRSRVRNTQMQSAESLETAPENVNHPKKAEIAASRSPILNKQRSESILVQHQSQSSPYQHESRLKKVDSRKNHPRPNVGVTAVNHTTSGVVNTQFNNGSYHDFWPHAELNTNSKSLDSVATVTTPPVIEGGDGGNGNVGLAKRNIGGLRSAQRCQLLPLEPCEHMLNRSNYITNINVESIPMRGSREGLTFSGDNSGMSSSGSSSDSNGVSQSETKAGQIIARPNGTTKVMLNSDCTNESNEVRIIVNQRNYKSKVKQKQSTRTRVFRTMYRSRSLPTILDQRYQSPDDDTKFEHEDVTIFARSNQLQLRAVSSPSLSDDVRNNSVISNASTTRALGNSGGQQRQSPLNAERRGGPHSDESQRVGQTIVDDSNEGGNAGDPGAVSASVLQKFRKTLSHHLKGKPPANATSVVTISGQINGQVLSNVQLQPVDGQAMNEIMISNGSGGNKQTSSHRFGPLVWRTSKERRKAKHQRRDKCNSGDSGIHVELENDDLIASVGPSGVDTGDCVEARNMHVRRANSAKSGPSATSKPARDLSKSRGDPQDYQMHNRSLSQPSDLHRVPGEHVDHHHDDGSDTDSLASQQEDFDEPILLAQVIFPFQPGGPQELGLTKGTIVEVLKRDNGPWWWGRLKTENVIIQSESELQKDDHHGWFPKDFVRLLPTKILPDSNPLPLPETMAGTSGHCAAMRDKVIKELLETEINYVKLLSSLCSGFLAEMRQHPEIFPSSSLDMIFSNVEEIFRFQQSFLEGLSEGIKGNQIAQAFLQYQSAFMVYSTYCNSYTRALNELDNYAQNKDALLLMEACRQRENLPELPLQAHLLAPIQRICKYPLHLMELVKCTETRAQLIESGETCVASDTLAMDCKESFNMALSAMRRVTEMVNEGKRNSEYLARLQQKFDSFKGPALNMHSTRLFLQIDATRMTPNLWNNTYTLFLFDGQLILVKRDLLKRNQYLYKCRIFLDNCRVLNLPNGKMFGVTLKNALRIYCDFRGKWYDFCFRSIAHKHRFLNMLTVERQFCGKSLFLSELAGTEEDMFNDVIADGPHNEAMIDMEINDMENYDYDLIDQMEGNGGGGGQKGQMHPPVDYKKLNEKYNSETLPKKSKRQLQQRQLPQSGNYPMSGGGGAGGSGDYHSASLGRRRLGNWFRKAKSTNSTPSHSPTHQQAHVTLQCQSSTTSLPISDSSSQNSPSLVRANGIIIGGSQADNSLLAMPPPPAPPPQVTAAASAALTPPSQEPGICNNNINSIRLPQATTTSSTS